MTRNRAMAVILTTVVLAACASGRNAPRDTGMPSVVFSAPTEPVSALGEDPHKTLPPGAAIVVRPSGCRLHEVGQPTRGHPLRIVMRGQGGLGVPQETMLNIARLNAGRSFRQLRSFLKATRPEGPFEHGHIDHLISTYADTSLWGVGSVDWGHGGMGPIHGSTLELESTWRAEWSGPPAGARSGTYAVICYLAARDGWRPYVAGPLDVQ